MIFFEEEYSYDFSFDKEEVANLVVEETLHLLQFPYKAQISITLTDEEKIRTLNAKYRETDTATDVLSFPLIEYEQPGEFGFIKDDITYYDMETNHVMLGDIVLSVPHIIRQAQEYGHSIKREYAFLIAHSMLHLMGYDHITQDERSMMENKQDQILQNLHITREIR